MLCGGHGQLSWVSARDGLSTNLSASLRSLSTRAKSPACCALARWNCGPSLPSKMYIVTLAASFWCPVSPRIFTHNKQSGLDHGTSVSLYLCHLLLEVTVKHSGGHQASVLTEHHASPTLPTLPNSRGHREAKWQRNLGSQPTVDHTLDQRHKEYPLHTAPF